MSVRIALTVVALIYSHTAAAQQGMTPTPEQQKAAEVALSKLGAKLRLTTEPETERSYYLVWLPGDNSSVTLKGLPNLPFSFGLNRYNGKMTDADLTVLKGLSNLTYLDLADKNITNSGLKELKELKNLTYLNLKGTKVTDAGLAELKDLTNLIYLNLEDTNVTQTGLKELAPFTKLRLLRLDDPLAVHNLPTLRKLGLLHALPEAKGSGQSRPAGPADVVTLELLGLDFSTDGLKELKDFKNLTRLEFRPAWLSDRAMANLREIGLLHALWRAKASEDARPTQPSEVVSINLRDTRVTGDGLKELKDFKNLTDLVLSNDQLTDLALAKLREVGLLHSLSLAFGTNGVRPTRSTEIIILNLQGTKISSAGLKELQGLTKLTELDLSHTRVTNAGLKELTGFSNLTKLNLYRTKVTEAGIRELQKVLPRCEITR